MSLNSGQINRYKQGTVTANATSDVVFTHPSIKEGATVLLAMNASVGSASGRAYVHERDNDANTITIASLANDTSVYDVIVFP